jgi:hypothetical protein
LEDGSEVQLNPNSTISYPEHFGQKTRTVYLKGEAFFLSNEIQPNHLWYILVIWLLKFLEQVLPLNPTRIQIYRGLVRTGKVSVYERKNAENTRKNGVILTPNQKVIFERIQKLFQA